MAVKKGKRRPPQYAPSEIFLPDHLDQVRAIAMRGLTDAEMASFFAIPHQRFQAWKRFYPDFERAIKKGRTHADVEVVQALFKKSVGFTKTVDRMTKEGDVVTVEQYFPPDMSGIKFWLTNRQAKHWSDRSHTEVSGKKGAPAIGVNAKETKSQLVASILSLIQPKPDK